MLHPSEALIKKMYHSNANPRPTPKTTRDNSLGSTKTKESSTRNSKNSSCPTSSSMVTIHAAVANSLQRTLSAKQQLNAMKSIILWTTLATITSKPMRTRLTIANRTLKSSQWRVCLTLRPRWWESTKGKALIMWLIRMIWRSATCRLIRQLLLQGNSHSDKSMVIQICIQSLRTSDSLARRQRFHFRQRAVCGQTTTHQLVSLALTKTLLFGRLLLSTNEQLWKTVYMRLYRTGFVGKNLY